MRSETAITVTCPSCQVVVGLMHEVEVDTEKRPGFFRNVCNPNPMPTKCPECHGHLERR